jgi:hypothetical protein
MIVAEWAKVYPLLSNQYPIKENTEKTRADFVLHRAAKKLIMAFL